MNIIEMAKNLAYKATSKKIDQNKADAMIIRAVATKSMEKLANIFCKNKKAKINFNMFFDIQKEALEEVKNNFIKNEK